MPFINYPPNLKDMFDTINNRLAKLETAQRFTAPNVATNPTNPRNGDIWLNTTSNAVNYIDGTGAVQTFTPPPYVAGKNAIINGGFDIWQRGTAVTQVGSANGINYLADRWTPNGYQDTRMQRITLGYQNANLNAPYAMRNSSSTTAQISYGTRIRCSQKIESSNSYLLAGKTVTVSYWVKFSAATISSSTATPYNNWYSSLDYYTTTTDGTMISTLPDSNFASYPFTNGTFPTTWTKVSYTATIPTGVNNVGLAFGFDGLGNTASADTAYYDLAQVQLELDSVATPFSRAGGSIGGELALCQRYYVQSYGGDSITTANYTSTNAYGVFRFPVTMRTTPTIGFSATSNMTVYSNGAGASPSAVVNGNIATSSVEALFVGSYTSGYAGFCRLNNAGCIQASAEL